ncbi:efflux RND transporter periplasmic adaptor subunit [Bdellovibrio sp. HCB337]|uniref:efflux RND transporter periplasmic adaptor subunit n=1 Tax=Bdellovibrio sp. HCB337 TaxID=3394358 RepID=UPI0039A43631
MKALLSNKHVWGVLVAFAGLFAVMHFTSAKDNKTTSGVVERGDLVQRVSLSGVVQPGHKAFVVAPYAGYVKKIYVKVGDKVKVGDPIVSVAQSLSNFEQTFPLRSPISGRVVQVRKNEGEYVKANDTTDFMVRVDDSSEMFVNVNAAEIDRVKIVENQEASLKPMALSHKSYKAKVVSLSLAANDKDRWDRSTVVEFPVTLQVTNPDAELQSGMTAVIEIITFKKEKVLMLRHEYIFTEGEQSYVLFENGKKQIVKIGATNEEKVEILEGLSEGDRVQKVDFTALAETE